MRWSIACLRRTPVLVGGGAILDGEAAIFAYLDIPHAELLSPAAWRERAAAPRKEWENACPE